jgi:hypothetical protein
MAGRIATGDSTMRERHENWLIFRIEADHKEIGRQEIFKQENLQWTRI